MLRELQEEIERHNIRDQWAILRKVKNRERDKARAKVNRLFERKNPKIEKVCQVCGSREKIEFHHTDYSKPYIVNVLCKYCHTDFHRGMIKIPIPIDLEELCEKKIVDRKGQKVPYKRQWLKDLWISKGYESANELADKCSITGAYIESIARSSIKPSERVAKELANILGFDYKKLLSENEIK